MSRIGKLPVAVPAGVEVKLGEENLLTIKGPKGTLERKLSADMNIAVEAGQIVVTRPSDLFAPHAYLVPWRAEEDNSSLGTGVT